MTHVRKWLPWLALGLTLWAGFVHAQTPGLQWLCAPIDAGHPSGGWCPASAQYPIPVVLSSPGTQLSGNATGTTGAVVGTLAAASGETTYICGFNVSAIGGTAAVGPITVAGLPTSQVYQLASSAGGSTLVVPLAPCIAASGPNTAITVTTTADGTASAVSVNSWGYHKP